VIQKLSDRFLFLQLARSMYTRLAAFHSLNPLVPYNRIAEECFRHHPGLLLLSTKLS
jgi:hypothetical protein